MEKEEMEKEKESFNIDITKKLEAFKHRLTADDRVVFSAKFGNGKSYFLDKFKQKYEEDSFFITLYPVNYSVATNEDVFEYIKRDILFQLVANNLIIDEFDWAALRNAIKNSVFANKSEIIDFISVLICNPCFALIASQLKRLCNVIKDTKQSYDEGKISASKYLKSFTTKGLYECDGYTTLIKEVLNVVKAQNKETVLIIEDLDRLDPAHLFRLLNVFSAHIDRPYIDKDNSERNKYGFDRIVFVMDYDVTKNIFYHFYGKKANYDGYMRKFYTSEPFQYSLHLLAEDYIYDFTWPKLLETLKKPIDFRASETLREKIQSLSIRDIKSLATLNPVPKMRVNEIEGEKNYFKFSSDQLIFNLFVLLHSAGCNYSEFCKVVDELFSRDEFNAVRLLFPLCLFENGYLGIDGAKGERNEYYYEFKGEDGTGVISIISVAQKIVSGKLIPTLELWNYLNQYENKMYGICVLDNSMEHYHKIEEEKEKERQVAKNQIVDIQQ